MTNTDLCFIHLHSAMSPNTSILFIVTLWASMQAGLGLPVVKQLEVETTDSVPPLRERTKRCACSTPLDSECHYFCHLDIIWVNTPSKMTVYGLGSAMPRRRRSSGRCTCANPEDQTCTSFCHSPAKPTQKPSAKRRLSTLNILRVAVSRPERVLDAADSDQTQRKNAR